MDSIDWAELDRYCEELCEDEWERERYRATTPLKELRQEATMETPKKVKQITFPTGDELALRVKNHCKDHGVPIGEFCRAAVEAALAADLEPKAEPTPPAEPAPQKEAEPITRGAILDIAREIVCTDREAQYGAAENNFGVIAALWNAYIGAKGGAALKAHDVAAMMIHLKTARIATGRGKVDNWVDIAGYAACGGECQGAGDD